VAGVKGKRKKGNGRGRAQNRPRNSSKQKPGEQMTGKRDLHRYVKARHV
jgi:hypothetical protein